MLRVSLEIMQIKEEAGVFITIDQKLDRVVTGSESQSCIFKVHDILRKVNEKAYEPEIVAIGPYHRNKSHLKMMEEHKLRFLKLLLQRKKDKVSKYVAAMKLLEEEARKCYAEPLHLSSDEFIEMMVLDGCFIIELLHKFKMLKDSLDKIKNDPLFRMEWTLDFLQLDLILFENQIPFFILTKLYEMIERPGQQDKFINLALEFFNDLLPGRGRKREMGVPQDNIKHLLDLVHRNWSSQKLKPVMDVTWNMDNLELIRCSTELAEAGIKFQKIDDEVIFDIQFNSGLLRIPVFTIEDRTESFLRNLIAYEQYCGDTNFNIVTDYVTFFSCLIKSAKDVTKLSRHGILRNFVGDNEVVCRMFSEMNNFIAGPSRNFHYGGIFRRVNKHCERRRNKWMARLRRKHMHSPWGIISIAAASTLLLLTFLQAIFQIWSWKDAHFDNLRSQ